MEKEKQKEMLEVVEEKDVGEVVKGMLCYERGIRDEGDLEKVKDQQFEELDRGNLLDEDIQFKSMEYRGV